MTGILALANDRADLGGPFLNTPPSSFGERFGAAFDESNAPDRWFNVEGARREKWQASIDGLQQATGKTYEHPMAFIPGAGSAGPDGQVIDPVAVRRNREQTIIQAYNEATKDVGATLPQDPNLIEQQIAEEGRGIRQKADSLVGTGNGMGAFFGAMAAPTPENIAGFLIPPSKFVFGARAVGQSFLGGLAREATYQAGANVALTAASDLADLGGAKEGADIPGDLLGAAMGGAVLGAGFHTLFHSPKALWERWNGLPQAVRDAAPLEVKDSFNVLEREALFDGKNALGIDPLQHEKAQAASVAALAEGKAPNVEGIVAYHGSPFQFDRFDASKIGSGEGAQAYGHGLYFAENEGVARGYQNRLSDADALVGGEPFDQNDISHIAAKAAAEGQSPAELRESARLARFYRRDAEGESEAAGLEAIATRIESGNLPKYEERRLGHLYEARIKAKPEQFLDWDKPFSEQTPEVQKAINALWVQKGGTLEGRALPPFAAHPGGTTGEDLHAAIATSYGTGNDSAMKAAASEALRSQGIAGIRYRDQGSRTHNVQILSPSETTHGQWLVKQIPNGEVFYRGKDEAAARTAYDAAPKPTHNLVVFPGNEHLIQITRRNGEPLTTQEAAHLQATRDAQAFLHAAETKQAAAAPQPVDVSTLLKGEHATEARAALLAEHEAALQDETDAKAIIGCLPKGGA